jgi:predicted neutral ceramidase superfamily lipid hydrolase
MTQFVDEIRQRVSATLDDLAEAQAAGDEYRVRVHTGELESFARLAHDNDIHVPELVPFAAA